MRKTPSRVGKPVALEPYARRHRQGVRDLLSRWRAFPEDDMRLILEGLDALDPSQDSGRARARVAEASEDGSVLGVSWGEPVGRMRDRWILNLLAVHPRRTGYGLGSALLSITEELARRFGAIYMAIEVPWFVEAPVAEGFFRSQGYRSYDGMGLPKRYGKSSYFVREL